MLASGPRLSGPLCAPGGSFSCPQASFFRLVSSPAGVLLQRSWGLGLSYLRLQCGLGMSPVRVFFNRTFCKALSLRRASSSRATLRARFCQILCGPGWSHGPVCPQAACAWRPATRPARPPSCFSNHLAGLLASLDAFRSCHAGGICGRDATGGLPDSFAFGACLRAPGHSLVPLRRTGFNCEKPSAKNLRRT
jgi:hypothetical protein